MKTKIKFLLLLTAFALTAGCVSWYVHHPDPLAGWQKAYRKEPNQIIKNDYQDYIEKLSPKERKNIGSIFYFEDGHGQHAMRIYILLDGTEWSHILIYDKQDKRIQVIKYVSGHYMS